MIYPWVRTANGIFFWVLIALFVVGLVIASFTDTWTLSVALGLPIIAVPLFLIKSYPDARMTRVAVGVAVQLITALHIHQTFGMIEVHFQIFVLLAFLIFYRDWLVIATATAVVAVHHVLFFFLQTNGVQVMVFAEGRDTFGLLVIHAIYAIAEGGILMYVASRSFNSALASLKLSRAIDDILKDPEHLDLTVELEGTNGDGQSFRQFMNAVRDLIIQTRQVGSALHEVSLHVAELSNAMTNSLHETSNYVESIATEAEQMSSTTADVSSNASSVNSTATQTKDLSTNAKQTIMESNEDVTQLSTDLVDTSATINALSEKCDRISQVMEAIKVISEQTNLLALNAAIESARAGEHGRGFAVVADEVRSLSIKTRESVEEISEVSQALITDGKTSVTQMQQCLQSAERAMKASSDAVAMIEDVQQAIANVEFSISDVAGSAEQQLAASISIASSAQQLTNLSQKESASARESLSEVELLRQHSQELEQRLSKFRV